MAVNSLPRLPLLAFLGYRRQIGVGTRGKDRTKELFNVGAEKAEEILLKGRRLGQPDMATCLEPSNLKSLAALQALKRLHVWDADFKKMRERHRAAALRLHPDKAPRTGGDRMRELNGAYAMAKTPELHFALSQLDLKARAREEDRAHALRRRETMQKETGEGAPGEQKRGESARGLRAGKKEELERAEKRKAELMAKLREHDRKLREAVEGKRNVPEERKVGKTYFEGRKEQGGAEKERERRIRHGEDGVVLNARIFCEDSEDGENLRKEHNLSGEKERNGTEEFGEAQERKRRGLEDFARGVEFSWREELRKARAQMGRQTTILDKLREEARNFGAGGEFGTGSGPPEESEAGIGSNARAKCAQQERERARTPVDELIGRIMEKIRIMEVKNEERLDAYRATRLSERADGA
ncbi:hypothetical protein KFL_000100440 [Klebsormidium nitens]|uniref:J domain-containing protein n=1 Tax=Klebsormidium nitens TaxID=105231 RepID=A0A1Y1HM64_KLENI|nr:hypothetical protein KFL_000100440 [Klebsormidium nitens]|eukprot:GAQ78279.1 hypothetical protein KFL_000100440 [Klebsormidium nitens]